LSPGLVAAYFVLTSVYVLSLGQFIETLNVLNTTLIALVAIATALLLVMLVYRAKATAETRPEAGLAGAFLGAFASACPFCQPIWLAWLGFGGSIAVLADYSLPISLASLALLAWGVQNTGKAIASKTCGPRSPAFKKQ
jgi:hypothetical protein